MNEQLALLPGRLAAHLGLALAALLLGALAGVPLGVLAHRRPRLGGPLLASVRVVQTIPGLALLAAMVPALAALGAPSIGYLPALIGLVLYSLLPILQNTVVGLAGVDPAVIEAAQGVGMTPGEQLRQVELPLALPLIVAGIRTSAVWTVGTATLSTPIGAPSLGDYLFGGLQTRNFAAVLVGCVAAAGAALLLDGLIWGLGLGLQRQRRGLAGAALAALLSLGVFAAIPAAHRALGQRPRVVIGAKTFTEQYVLAHVLAGQIERGAGLPTKTLQSLGSTVVFDALHRGQIDALVDYTGTLWTTALQHQDTPPRAELLERTSRELRERFGIEVVCSLGFENTYALAMRREDAARLGIRRISDLTGPAGRLKMGGDYEIFQRQEWRSLERHYGLAFAEQRSMDPSLMYQAIQAGEVGVISAYSTDGRVASYGLVALEDDRGAIPPYDAVILVSGRLAREQPRAVAALRALAGKIDAPRMQRMNAAVDEGKASPAQVARRFLEEMAR